MRRDFEDRSSGTRVWELTTRRDHRKPTNQSVCDREGRVQLDKWEWKWLSICLFDKYGFHIKIMSSFRLSVMMVVTLMTTRTGIPEHCCGAIYNTACPFDWAVCVRAGLSWSVCLSVGVLSLLVHSSPRWMMGADISRIIHSFIQQDGWWKWNMF